MEFDTLIKKIGDEFIVVLPKDFVKNDNLKLNQKISISIIKKADLTSIFGSLKGLKIDAQKMKDETRKDDARKDKKLMKLLRKK